MRKLKVLNILSAIIILAKINLYAVGSGGIANEVTSAEDLSNLLAITGSKTDPTVVYHNPAGILDQGKLNTSLGLTYFDFSVKREGSNGTSDKMKTTKAVVPNFGLTQGLADGKLAWGLAVVSPYGLQTEWSDTSNVRYVATKSTLNMLDVTPAIAYRPIRKLSVGFGLDYYTTFKADLQKKISVDAVNFQLGFPTAGSPDANSKLSGDGDQWGYHTGFVYNPTESHTFGVAYHSEVKTKIEGDLELTGLSGASAVVFGGSDYKTHAETDLFYPQNVQLGYKYSKGDKWEAGFNAAWYDWSANQELRITLPNATANQKAVAEQATPLKWRDVWSATIGGFYRFSDKWKLNMGAFYLPKVYPGSTFSPGVPDLSKIGISVGPSYTKNSFSIDTVYNPVFLRSRDVKNNLGQAATGSAAADVSGKYKGMLHIIGITARYRFS